MKFCFVDPDIGSVDPAKPAPKNKDDEKSLANKILNTSHAKNVRNLAIENCEHTIFLMCAPDTGISYSACSGYLNAGLSTGHTMLFTGYNGNWDVTKTSTAINMLKSKPKIFITEYGDDWLFCKCKPDRLSQCEGMSRKDVKVLTY